MSAKVETRRDADPVEDGRPPRVEPLPFATSNLPHDRAIQLLTLFAGLPGVMVSLVVLWAGDWTLKVQWTFSLLVVAVWLGCVFAVRERIIYPMQTLTNLLAALREGDYSLRSRRARRDDALGDVMREINLLGDTLLTRRREAQEAVALSRAVLAGIDVAVFTFDDTDHLRLVNRAGSELLGQPEGELVGCSAAELGLAASLEGDNHRTLDTDFPGRTGARWSLYRTSFREKGRPHQLLVLADVSQSLRDEERAAWQRLIRVLGHEINNSLAPIASIAESLLMLLNRPEPARLADWQDDTRDGLEVIAGRSQSLSRFMAAYSDLARLPPPERQRQSLAARVRRAAALETRLAVQVGIENEATVLIDGDQIEQALINLIKNAADASLETGGGVRVDCAATAGWAVVVVQDDGLGLSGTTNLFVPFFTTKSHGSGIGLVLSRQIVEAHGGTLTLQNRADGQRGCWATLRLPTRL